jgi:chorismate dehydratase
MTPVRLGAVGYLNARPLMYGLDRQDRFAIRYDLPARCAQLLHDRAVDVGLIPSIEYLRGGPYSIVPDLAIASHGAVASVALYTKKPMRDVRSIALDTSSRTSAALVRVLCAQLFRIDPELTPHGPDLEQMLARADAALIIGDNALFLTHGSADGGHIVKIDLGEAWFELTGLPFVYAFWAGRPEALRGADVAALHRARDEGIARSEELAREYLASTPDRQAVGARYLRDNIQYFLGDKERAGLQTFYRYAAELGLVADASPPAFYDRP